MPNESRPAGRHFLQIPGPTPIPERIINAMSRQMLDHRGPEFQAFTSRLLANVKTLFNTSSPVLLYPSSGTGAWEASLVNTMSPGDRILVVETGQFAVLWRNLAMKLGLKPDVLANDWHAGIDVNLLEERLRQDAAHDIKAVCVVHNETSTGTRTWIEEIRKAMDAARHPALLMVDAVSSLAVMDYRHDEWGVDVAVAGSQKGLMLPPGLSLTAVSDKALAASKSARLHERQWLLSLHAADRAPLRSRRGDRHAARGRSRQRVRTP
jgi:alanine-glyoxylate transaminase/serine-glyoxylate transaminase/serine-pyruvate transaminase